MPDFSLEREFWVRGLFAVAGVDEAGRGAWAGPVVVAAVILPPSAASWPLRDSKTVPPAERERLAARVREGAQWSTAHASAQEVDRLNVLGATRTAALRALKHLNAQALVTDYLRLDTALPQKTPARADSLSLSVAAASLLAKTERDAALRELDARYPGYGFAAHKGYGTAVHRAALRELGPTPEHRMSFGPLRAAAKGTL